jgi:hypothetical protein
MTRRCHLNLSVASESMGVHRVKGFEFATVRRHRGQNERAVDFWATR